MDFVVVFVLYLFPSCKSYSPTDCQSHWKQELCLTPLEPLTVPSIELHGMKTYRTGKENRNFLKNVLSSKLYVYINYMY